MFEEYIKRMAEFETIVEARKFIVTIIGELYKLKKSNPIYYRNVLMQMVEHFKGKGSGDFRKEIDGYVKMAEDKVKEERFNEATDSIDRDKFDANADGVILASQKNMVTLLSTNKFLYYCYDTFTEQSLFQFKGEPLWHDGLGKDYLEIEYPDGSKKKWYRVNGHLAELKLYLHQFFPEERSWHELPDALEVVAKRNQFDLYMNWMDEVPEWDGIDRMDFLYRYAGVQNRIWAMIIGHVIAMTMVARCYQPGFNTRGTPILEGPENKGKSMLVRRLSFDERFFGTYSFSNKNEYESARQFRGRVAIEVPERVGIDGKNDDFVKSLVTLTQDINRRHHDNDVEYLPRRFIMIMTCNESTPYLKGDGEGDTRWFPCRCVGIIDFEAIRRELPLILSQAKYLFEFDINMARPTEAEWAIQRQFVEPRQIKPDYYYWVLDALKLNQKQLKDDNWDHGFTMDEMLGWCEKEPWYATKNKTHHRKQIAVILPKYFNIESTVKKVPVHYKDVKEYIGKDTTRKWRYVGKVEWYDFISNMED